MKTKFLNLLAVTVIAFTLIIISSSKKVKAADKPVTMTRLAHVKHINKIIVNGNVDVYLNQGSAEDLKVYNDYYSKNALVQWENGTLRISSFEKEKLAVWITVTDLAVIEASGNSSVRSLNSISSIDLSINLAGQATANIEAKVVNLYSSVADAAKLELAGDSENQQMELSGISSYDASRFTAQNRSVLMSDNAVASFTQDGKTTSIKTLSARPKTEELSLETGL